MDIETKIDQILKIVTMVQQDLAAMKKEFNELKEKDIAKLKEDVAILKEDVEILKKEVAKLKERMTNLERSVTLIELQHGDKISALFDNMKVNEDKHEEIKDLCLSIESKIQATLFNHERRIKKLEGNLVPVL